MIIIKYIHFGFNKSNIPYLLPMFLLLLLVFYQDSIITTVKKYNQPNSPYFYRDEFGD